jgi:1-acyl-sn-glycerol-3-phosphate acyltransferase
MRVLATLWLALLMLLTLPLAYALAVGLLVATARSDPGRRLAHRFVAGWCSQYLRCWPGWRLEVRPGPGLPAGPCVLVANHQSMADVLALMALPGHFKFVSKASLFELPAIGRMMRWLRYVPLERGRLRSAESMLAACASLLQAGERVLIFPEATYAEGGGRLPFRRGAFRLAQLEQVPVVLVTIQGTEALVAGDGPWFSPRGEVVVEVREVLPPPEPEEDLAPLIATIEARYRRWLGPWHDGGGGLHPSR